MFSLVLKNGISGSMFQNGPGLLIVSPLEHSPVTAPSLLERI